jgi:ATP-dependent RNA helicase RhlE
MTKFSQMPLSAALQQRLASSNFTVATPVQAAAIPPALEGKDVLATAHTGTGKTLAFLLPVMQKLLHTPARGLEVLVLVPTRELGMQVHEQHEQLRGRELPAAALIIGGVSEKPQISALRNARVAISTPGRFEDLLGRRLVNLRHVNVLVLDEADRMLDIGFLPAIQRIARALPTPRQTLCFSATLEASVANLVHEYMKQPVRVAVGSVLKPVDSVELIALEVPLSGKPGALRQLLAEETGRTLIFARTKRGTERLAKDLKRQGFNAAMIHGDRSQSQRNTALAGFEEGRYTILVATDVASRGIDVPDITHVINYDLPKLPEDFIHRVGRTGRAGATGKATSLVSGADFLELRNIERVLRIHIERRQADAAAPPPPGDRSRNTLPKRTLVAFPGEVFV